MRHHRPLITSFIQYNPPFHHQHHHNPHTLVFFSDEKTHVDTESPSPSSDYTRAPGIPRRNNVQREVINLRKYLKYAKKRAASPLTILILPDVEAYQGEPCVRRDRAISRPLDIYRARARRRVSPRSGGSVLVRSLSLSCH